VKQLFLLAPADFIAQPEKHRDLGPACLGGYASLWHPSLLLGAESPPALTRPDEIPPPRDWLALAPAMIHAALAPESGWAVKENGELLPLPEMARPDPDGWLAPLKLADCDAEFRADFYALGFTWIALSVLYERMGQANSADLTEVFREAKLAAERLYSGDLEGCAGSLRAAFDVMHNARQLMFAATINLVDFVLPPPRIDAAMLAKRLECQAPANLIATGAELDRWAAEAPDLLEGIKRGLSELRLEVASGTYDDVAWTPLSQPERIAMLERSAESFRRNLDRDCDYFACRSIALGPDLPQLLMKFQYRYAYHGAFDGGRLPAFRGPKINWNAADGSSLETLAQPARNGGDERDALAAIAALAATLKNDRGPTLVFARWLGSDAWWLEQWLRGNDYAPVLGRFQTLNDYFLNSTYPDNSTETRADEYSAPRLAAGGVDPIGRWADRQRFRRRHEALGALLGMQQIASGGKSETPEGFSELAFGKSDADSALAAMEKSAKETLAATVLAGAEKRSGYLVVNPSGAPRRTRIVFPGERLGLKLDNTVRAVQVEKDRSGVALDLPGWGFAWIPRSGEDVKDFPLDAPAIASGKRLRNEFVEVEIDSRTGGIRGLWDVLSGYSRLGQQLVHGAGGRMVGTKCAVTAGGPAFGEITTEGEIEGPDGRRRAGFRQTFRLWRGRPLLEIDIVLLDIAELGTDADVDYLAVRWSWPDDKAIVRVPNGAGFQIHRGERWESATAIELRERHMHLAILPDGLPFHRRFDPRMADTLLVVRGESAREFRIGVGVDYSQALAATEEMNSPLYCIPVEHGPPRAGTTGWLARLDLRHVHCVGLRPLEDGRPGVLFRLAEHQNKPGRGDLRFCRDPRSARLVNGRRELIFDLYPVNDALTVDVSALEFQQIEVLFDNPPEPAADPSADEPSSQDDGTPGEPSD
jgi:alpha-mannosidase